MCPAVSHCQILRQGQTGMAIAYHGHQPGKANNDLMVLEVRHLRMQLGNGAVECVLGYFMEGRTVHFGELRCQRLHIFLPLRRAKHFGLGLRQGIGKQQPQTATG